MSECFKRTRRDLSIYMQFWKICDHKIMVSLIRISRSSRKMKFKIYYRHNSVKNLNTPNLHSGKSPCPRVKYAGINDAKVAGSRAQRRVWDNGDPKIENTVGKIGEIFLIIIILGKIVHSFLCDKKFSNVINLVKNGPTTFKDINFWTDPNEIFRNIDTPGL
uniref:Uncharacterized protein n=1 Tax=Romanomermis culicivorax TaxID=13658 RepID=A0A915KT59_ROMCU